MNAVNNNASSAAPAHTDAPQRPQSGIVGNSFSDLLRNLDDTQIRLRNPLDDIGTTQPVQPAPQATPTPADKAPVNKAARQPEGKSETQTQEARAAAAPAAPAASTAPEAADTQAQAPAAAPAKADKQAKADQDAAEKPEAADTEAAGKPAELEPQDKPASKKARTAKLLDTAATATTATAQHGPAQTEPALALAAQQSAAQARAGGQDKSAASDSEAKDSDEASPRNNSTASRGAARLAGQRADLQADAAALPSRAAAEAAPGAAAVSSFAAELGKALPAAGAGMRVAADGPALLGALGATGNSTAASTTEANAPTAQITLSQPLDDAGFGAELGARLAVLTQDGVQHAELHLNPAEMGPVAVQISVDGQQAQVSFQAAHAATRSALEQSLPDLAAALSAAGLTLAGGGVFQQFQQSQGGQAGAGQGGGGADAASDRRTAGITATENTGIPNVVRRGGATQALVDLYA